MEYQNEVISIISEVTGFDPDEIEPEMELAKDLDVDSIKAIEIAVFIEKKFKIALRDEDIAKITNVRQILDLTGKLLN